MVWFISGRDIGGAGLARVVNGTGRPAWIGAPVYSIPDASGMPRAALYPVCLSPSDVRCAIVAANGSP
jgi:hypothetical protein